MTLLNAQLDDTFIGRRICLLQLEQVTPGTWSIIKCVFLGSQIVEDAYVGDGTGLPQGQLKTSSDSLSISRNLQLNLIYISYTKYR